MNCLNSRFIFALLVAFVYACIVPASIRLRMGPQGWHWIWNDLAFGFFMVGVFPFAAAIFACIVNRDLLRKSLNVRSRYFVVLIFYVTMMGIVGKGVYVDLMDKTHERARQPYMLQDTAQMHTLADAHDQYFKTKDIKASVSKYRDDSNKQPLSRKMLWLFSICNFINVGFGVTVFCYIVLAGTDSALTGQKVDERTCNHLVFVITAMAVWFPCRAYSDWYLNLTDLSWISSYAAAWLLFGLLLVACIILAVTMVGGTLYHRFAIPAAATSAVFGALAAFKRPLLTQAAFAIAGFDPIFLAGFAILVIALLYYLSTLVHHPGPKSQPPNDPKDSGNEPPKDEDDDDPKSKKMSSSGD